MLKVAESSVLLASVVSVYLLTAIVIHTFLVGTK